MNPYVKQPRVGEVLEHAYGPVEVLAVHDYGRRLEVRDRIGRLWVAERADKGVWLRAEAVA